MVDQTPASQGTSYDVRVWSVTSYRRKNGRTYGVRWAVGKQRPHRTFATRALAESFRAELLMAARQGQPFDLTTGLPVTMLPTVTVPTWYEHACAFVDARWPHMAPKSRESIADGLAAVTPALLVSADGGPSPAEIRRALRGWAFNAGRRQADDTPPAEWAPIVAWIARQSRPIDVLDDLAMARRVLDSLTVRLDGTPAAATTVARRRAVFHNAIQYAVELGHFTSNPLRRFKWKAPKVAEAVDRRAVVNHEQARALLTGVALTGETGRRLVAFFACMYYAALRPGEVVELRADDLVPPASDDDWPELILGGSNPATAAAWTDNGKRERRQLKHRAMKDTRTVPCAPPLWELLQAHIELFGTAPDGRLFRGARGGPVPDTVCCRVWQEARRLAFTPAEVASPLAARPYDLRHAAVSTWLNAGVDAAQVAEWAGHSVNVLLRVYAKCVVGRDRTARRRIAEALEDAPPE